MDKNFFGEQISRLRVNYSPGAMNDERVQVMWDRFKGVENRVFKNAVDYLISEYTTQTLPALSKFAEAVGMFRTGHGAAMNLLPPPYDCEPCRDFGYGWIGETIVACTCAMGRHISPEELAKQQANYDKGKKLLKKGHLGGVGGLIKEPPKHEAAPRPAPLSELGSTLGSLIDQGMHLSEEDRKKRGFTPPTERGA